MRHWRAGRLRQSQAAVLSGGGSGAQGRRDPEAVGKRAGVVGADIIGAVLGGKQLGRQRRGAELGGGRMSARPRAETICATPRPAPADRRPASARRAAPARESEASGRLLKKNPMPGSMTMRSRATPACSRAAMRSVKNVLIRSHTWSAESSSRCARPRPCTACMTTSRQRAAASSGYSDGSGKPWMSFRKSTPRAIAKRCTSGKKLSTETGVASAFKRRDQRVETADLLGRGDRFGIDIARRGAELDDVRAGCGQGARMVERRRAVDKPAAIRKRILGDVDDAEEGRARGGRVRHGSARTRPLEDRADAVGIGENVELLDPCPHPLDPDVGKAGVANPLGKALAQIDMARRGDLADRCRRSSRN